MHKPLAGVIDARATPAGATCDLSRLRSSAPEVPHNFLLPVTYASRVRHGSTRGHNRVSPRLGHIRRRSFHSSLAHLAVFSVVLSTRDKKKSVLDGFVLRKTPEICFY